MWQANIGRATGYLAVTLQASLLLSSVGAADPQETGEQLKASVQRLEGAKKSRTQGDTVEGRVREITWRLLVGELATDKSNGLSSAAFDALTRGLKELDELQAEIEKSPALERKLTDQPQLAMRLDATQARLTELAAKKDVSRADELARLSQLRELNRSYRALIEHLVASQTEALVGQLDEVAKNGDEATKNLATVDAVVAQRRDFYLFDDEPAVEGGDGELKLVKSLAAPYAADVRRHHQGLLGLTLWRLATRTEPANKELLEAALVQADAALTDATTPNAVAFYARGLSCLELGRLLTAPAPFQQRAHADAAEWFAKSLEAFTQAKKSIPATAKLTAMSGDLDRLLKEGTDPQTFSTGAIAAEQSGDLQGAGKALMRGVTRHRTPALATAWVEARWRFREVSYAEVEKLFAGLLSDGVASADDVNFLALRGRVAVLQVWRVISELPEGRSIDEQRVELLAILQRGQADLTAIPADVAPAMKWTNAALLALADATAMLLDPQPDMAAARLSLTRVPIVATELEALAADAAPTEKVRLIEAVQLARLAEGYLSLRLLPDYQDRARTAFAAAADAGAKLKGNAGGLQPVGSAMLRAMLSRESASGDRMAQEERQLRGALQRMLPALAALPTGDPQRVAESLSMALRDVQSSELAWDPRKQLDPRDVVGAREGVLSDARAVTVLAMLSAKQPAAALREFLVMWFPDLKADGIEQLDWAVVRERASGLSDPLSVFAFGSALEEFAVAQLEPTQPLRAKLLEDARRNQERALSLLAETSAWRDRWPYLNGMATTARDRLVSESSAIERAISLRREMRLTEARAVLAEAQQRHPASVALQAQLIDTLIDEAQMTPDRETELIAEALKQLEDAKRNSADLPTSAIMKLAELRERAGQPAAATVAYREVNERSKSRAEQIKARSRLAVLKARTVD